MPKILFLTAYPEEDASCRYRIHQFIPSLSAAGHQCTVAPFATPELFCLLTSQGSLARKVLETFRCGVHRLRRVLAAADYDLVVIHREAFPFFAPAVEKLLLSRARRGRRTKVVFSFDDAIYAGHGDTSTLHYPWLYRWKHGRGYNHVIRVCDHVIVGNRLLAEYATQLNPAATIIPTVVDCDKYRPRETEWDRQPTTIGWMGSRTTAPYLCAIEPALRRIAAVHGQSVRFCFVGCPEYKPDFGPSVSLPFRLETEMHDLHGFDIGLMPLPDDPWTRGKCAFKAIQYMASGVVTVASPVGITPDLVRHGGNGFLAISETEWFDALDRLLRDYRLRLQVAREARRTIEASYSLQVWAPRMLALIDQLLGKQRILERETMAA